MNRFALIALIVFTYPVFAASLFGLDLQQATQEAMRNALRQSGAVLVKGAGNNGFYDEYESQNLLHGSSRLYLGYEKKNNRLAFVEYTFEGLNHPQLLPMLSAKYGKPQKLRARFQSDNQYKWQSDGVQILLYQDWSSYKVRLMYALPQNLAALRREFQQFSSSQAASQRVSSELAY